MKITSTSNTDDIRVFINDTLHLYILKESLVGIQAFNNAENDYSIQIHFTSKSMLLQYDGFDKWSRVLGELNSKL